MYIIEEIYDTVSIVGRLLTNSVDKWQYNYFEYGGDPLCLPLLCCVVEEKRNEEEKLQISLLIFGSQMKGSV